MPKCLVLHPFCQVQCCRTLRVNVEPHEIKRFGNVVDAGERILPRVTINEDKFPGGEQVCTHWNPETWKCSLKSRRRKAPQVCETFSCIDKPGIWSGIEHNVAKMERGERLMYPLESEGWFLTKTDVKAARREVDRLNTIKRRELLKEAKRKADRLRNGSEAPF
jgi:hypothetical protein